MKFSIVVPTYNEERDVAATLDHLVALDGDDYEILVVDDSTDRTPEIVRSYAERGVSLIRPEKPEGRCGARNLGILKSTGDVVVILNADVHLPKDFLQRIAAWYEAGYDYVLVRSEVENLTDLYARYVECRGIADYYGANPEAMEWAEGFSCRRESAIRAGMFPVGYAVPICAGEDGYFGQNLRGIGARKKVDLDIVVKHVAPAAFTEYWRIRTGRGRGSPQVRRFLHKWSWPRIVSWATLRVAKTLAWIGLLFPMLKICSRAARESPRGQADLLPFCWAWLIEQAAFHVGEWTSIAEVWRAERINDAARR
jgi:Glycosyl transferase family 2